MSGSGDEESGGIEPAFVSSLGNVHFTAQFPAEGKNPRADCVAARDGETPHPECRSGKWHAK
jgi:hypothetical protein